MSDSRPIGLFDSGVGGLTVVHEVFDRLPGEEIVYFGDTVRASSGSKSPETAARCAAEGAAFLLSQTARLLVVSCDAAAAIPGAGTLGGGRVPVLDAIDPSVRHAIAATRSHAIGVIGTRPTIAGGAYERRLKALNPAVRVVSASCPLLVPLVEEGWASRPVTTMILKRYLLPVKTRQIDTLILGCAHYSVLKPIIQRKIGGRVTVIDSAQTLAEDLREYLQRQPHVDATLSRSGRLRVCVSDETEMTAVLTEGILGMPVSPERVSITGS